MVVYRRWSLLQVSGSIDYDILRRWSFLKVSCMTFHKCCTCDFSSFAFYRRCVSIYDTMSPFYLGYFFPRLNWLTHQSWPKLTNTNMKFYKILLFVLKLSFRSNFFFNCPSKRGRTKSVLNTYIFIHISVKKINIKKFLLQNIKKMNI